MHSVWLDIISCPFIVLTFSSANLEQVHLLPSRILYPHARFYVREMRIRAYSQLLESYWSLTLESLSTAFDVSTDFIDAELARFIALRGLKCTIDNLKVNGVVETDAYGREGKTGRAAQYEVVVRQSPRAYHEVRIPGLPGIRTLRLRLMPKEVRDSRTTGFPSPAGAFPVREKNGVPGPVRAASLLPISKPDFCYENIVVLVISELRTQRLEID